jgi:hypothetical protein
VPWWALLSLALLVGGLTVFVLKANKASDAATALIAAVAADAATGWPRFMAIYKDSVWPTVGVAGAAIAALVFAASVRLDQKLRKVGKYGGSKGERGCRCSAPRCRAVLGSLPQPPAIAHCSLFSPMLTCVCR